MKQTQRLMRSFCSDQSGQGVVEYAIMLVVVLMLTLGAVSAIGSQSSEVFHRVVSAIQ